MKGIRDIERTRNQVQTQGENSKSKVARVVILVCNKSSRSVLHFYQLKLKIIQRVLITKQTRNPIQTKEGEITPKVRKPVVILVRNMPSCPVLHFYQEISKYLERYSCYRADMKSNSNTIRGDNTKSKKAKVVFLVRDKLSRTVLHFHQVSQKYSKGYSTYSADTKSMHNHCQM